MANSRATWPDCRANPHPVCAGSVPKVKTVEENRRVNLGRLVEEAGSAAGLSRLTGVPQPYISQVARAVQHSTGGKVRTMGPDVARRLEDKMGKPRGWMDADHSALKTTSDLSGREGQLIGLFRLLNDSEQNSLIDRLTHQLRREPAGPPPQTTGTRH